MTAQTSRPFKLGLAGRAATLKRLGLLNVGRVALYRGALKNPLSRVRRLSGTIPLAPFFENSASPPVGAPPADDATDVLKLFSYLPHPVPAAGPDWQANARTGQRLEPEERPWWAIPDFDPVAGDIKVIWELSRFDWLIGLAQRARNRDGGSLTRLNEWLGDWARANPPYLGANWKCGQEASIRVMHLAMAQLVLGHTSALTPGLRDLILLHLRRIGPTTSYAVGQDNNHGTSEAAALFIGGSWLGEGGSDYAGRGRKLLEERVARLVAPDGTFSQYSVNYHRVLLDTLCMAEAWRRRCGLPAFSTPFYDRAAAATEWLRRMTDPLSGDAPNIGANDGARLLQLDGVEYRDYRPTVELAAELFMHRAAYAPAVSHRAVWLGLPEVKAPLGPPQSTAGEAGGFAVLRSNRALAVLRYPRLRFRPSQSDLLHLDFWLDGQNVLRDGGTYSYNTDPEWLSYFSGVASHNTVEFDGRDQMPRIGRFLFGAWPDGDIVEPLRAGKSGVSFGAAYSDLACARHDRRVSLSDTSLRVTDKVDGFC